MHGVCTYINTGLTGFYPLLYIVHNGLFRGQNTWFQFAGCILRGRNHNARTCAGSLSPSRSLSLTLSLSLPLFPGRVPHLLFLIHRCKRGLVQLVVLDNSPVLLKYLLPSILRDCLVTPVTPHLRGTRLQSAPANCSSRQSLYVVSLLNSSCPFRITRLGIQCIQAPW
jgi:hypothetical protein